MYLFEGICKNPHDGEVAQTGGIGRRRRRARAVPDVRVDVMVVAAGGEEGPAEGL